jgi:hypothetical protein
MSKKLNRKKPGFTKAGVAKIVSMNYLQLVNLLSKNSKKKVECKIRNRMRVLESRPGFVNPAKQSQPV